ncbi:MAG: NAD-glutamate dehydrogenase [Chlamydiia bacterium]|nr:NAD-glutamate dehydrogenase [Chlamydiia bacterium]
MPPLDKRNQSKEFEEALREETTRFSEFYLWLEKSMPKIFFTEVNRDWISLISHALMGFRVEDYFSEIHLKGAAISLIIDSPDADVRILKSYPMYGIKNYTTYISRYPLPFSEIQGYLRVAIIKFTEVIERPPPHFETEKREELFALARARNPELTKETFDHLMEKMDPLFLRKLKTQSQVLALELFQRAEIRDHCQYEVQYTEDWKELETYSMHLVIAWKNVPKHNFLYRLAKVVRNHKLVMRRVNASYTNPYTAQSIFLLSFDLHGQKGNAAWEATDIADFLQEIVTLKYFGSTDRIDKTFIETHLIRGNLGNFLRTTVSFVHQVLVNVDPNLYSLDTIDEALCRHPELTIKLCEAFENKFHPVKHEIDRYEEARDEFIQLTKMLDTGHEIHDNRRKNVLLQAMNFVHFSLKCNFFQNNKTSFCFRLNPKYLDHAPFNRTELFPELPFGIFFIKGMHFIGFHMRFKDLSRGGLRTVLPKKKETMVAERTTVFSECYNLAYTQHKKNKDIPEGGAKGVIFLKPYMRLESEAEIYAKELKWGGFSKEEIDARIESFKQEQTVEYLYQTQRSFIKSFLSLLNCDSSGKLKTKHVIDYYQKPEYIYLGPDENMHDSMITWIAQESRKIGYKPGGAFISGKPKLGINHKEYGVTSLGVNVYMHEVLKFLKIDPLKTPFTIKMTGGPDGDVAGNQIKNLYQLYPKTAKLVALTDISGTIYDPKGLDLEILYRLFLDCQSIRHYPTDKLSPGAFLLDKQTKREPTPYVQQTLLWKNKGGTLITEWLSGSEMNAIYRNNVHQTKADIFIPAGGRPRTLRESNTSDFLDKTGTPTAKAIIEGANLYLTPIARNMLEKAGVLIIKDSSANKGGVICSSYEILCSLALSDEEFLSAKSQLVSEILDALKLRSYQEASLLLATHKEEGEFLSDISDRISKRITSFTDQLLNYLEKITLSKDPKDPLLNCYLSYCPKTLNQMYGDRLLTNIPENHKKAVIASHIASTLVYQRGLTWFPSLVDILPLILKTIPDFSIF